MKTYIYAIITLIAVILHPNTADAQVTLNFTVRYLPGDSSFGDGTSVAAQPPNFPFVDGSDPAGPSYVITFAIAQDFTTTSADGTWSGTGLLTSVSSNPSLPASNWIGASTAININLGPSPGLSIIAADPNNTTTISSFNDGTEFIHLDLTIEGGSTPFTQFVSGQTLNNFFSSQLSSPYNDLVGILQIKTNLNGFPTAVFNVESLQVTTATSAIPEPGTYAALVASLTLFATLVYRTKHPRLDIPRTANSSDNK